MTKYTTKPQGSNSTQEHDAMLKEALACPGVREVMRVYQNHQEMDKGLDPYRPATKHPGSLITTDHANASKPVQKAPVRLASEKNTP